MLEGTVVAGSAASQIIEKAGLWRGRKEKTAWFGWISKREALKCKNCCNQKDKTSRDKEESQSCNYVWVEDGVFLDITNE